MVAADEETQTRERPEDVWRRCERFLGSRPRGKPAEVLAALAGAAEQDEIGDQYGSGEVVAAFEAEVAAILGKEAAVFMPSGTMAQQIALRIWSEQKGTRTVAFHPMTHLETHEEKAYQMLHGLHAILVGDRNRLLTREDLDAVAEPIAALLLELPQRDIGGQLPAWDDLIAQVDWAHERGAFVHMDGARLWETAPFYRRSYAEIAAPFDSVYVSFYKTLGALAGAMLAGPNAFIKEARVWRRRHGGDLFQFYPYVISARTQLHTQLDRIPEFVERAQALGEVLAGIEGVRVQPDPPQTNMMHVFLAGEREQLLQRAQEIAHEDRVLLFRRLTPTDVPGWCMVELAISDDAPGLSADEVRAYMTRLLA
ncbi:MAG TPA: beta-eliminating lyase-related protein [Chloroflexota bacterium]|nr:beta-eliminating lyase-related protein [Chloroflexota bacterium]